MSTGTELTDRIKQLAMGGGFARVGIAPASTVDGARRFKGWLERGCNGEMSYMARNVDKRFCPSELVGGARSVISLAVGYAPEADCSHVPGDGASVAVARYARGRDYHGVLKHRCRELMDQIRQVAPDFAGRAFVDAGPVAERSLAAAAGVGWIGNNGCLIVPGLGSYVVLAEIVCNLPLEVDAPVAPQCGGCDVCVRACPTAAILDDSLVDARRCLSYLTIEHGGDIAEELRRCWANSVFGCDICQEVCPFNKDAPPGDAELRRPPQGTVGQAIHGAGAAEVLSWSQADWDAATGGTAMCRTSFEMFMRNAILVAAASGDASLVVALEKLADRLGSLASLIDWAMNRIKAQDG